MDTTKPDRRRLDPLQDLPGAAEAVLQRPAVLVGAVVGGQRHEARQDAAHARHDLDGVEAGFLAHARRVEVLLLERLDLLERHARKPPMNLRMAMSDGP